MHAAEADLKTEQSLAEQAAGAIRTAILQAKFAPGERLIEKDIARLLNIGRGPVREALLLLSVEGMVTIARNKGAIVSKASKEMLGEVFEIRELLEGLAARRAALRIAAGDDPAPFRQLLDQERDRDIEQTPQALLEANERLHRAIVEFGGGEMLLRVIGLLQLPDMRALFFRMMSPAVWRASREEHITMLEAIIAGDANAAECAMRTHVGRTANLSAPVASSLLG